MGDVDIALLAFSAGQSVVVLLDEPAYARRYDHVSLHSQSVFDSRLTDAP